MGETGYHDDKIPARSSEIPEFAKVCERCHLLIARLSPHVITEDGKRYHRECFEAWYLEKNSRRPRLIPEPKRGQHCFRVKDQ